MLFKTWFLPIYNLSTDKPKAREDVLFAGVPEMEFVKLEPLSIIYPSSCFV